jgi:hypothetical protein
VQQYSIDDLCYSVGMNTKRLFRAFALFVVLVPIGTDRLAPATLDYRHYLLSRPSAYAHAPYWSRAFIAELSAWPLSCFAQDSVTWHGTYFNVESHCRRRVVGQPGHYEHTLWMIGSSTLYSSEVPDAYTIPSQVQQRLPHLRVVSVTTNAAAIEDELDLVMNLNIQPGDIVLMYSGFVDTLNSYQDFHVGRATLDAAISRLRLRYGSTLQRAAAYVRARAATFWHVLQPHLWSRPLTSRESFVTTSPFVPEGLGGAVPVLWGAIQSASAEGHTLDLTHILDRQRDSAVVYFEGWHGNEITNAFVARAIADAITPTL